MIVRADFSRPDVVFTAVWATVPALAYADVYSMGFENARGVTLLIAFNIATSIISYQIARRFVPPSREPMQPDADLEGGLGRVNATAFAVWVVLFGFIVWRSGGLPFFWRMAHVGKSYVDFGVPTLSGFANMLRALVFCVSVLLWLRSGNRLALLLGAIVFGSSVLEMARANTIFLGLSGAAVALIQARGVRLRTAAGIAALALLLVVLFGVAERYRSPGGSGGEGYLKYQTVLRRLPYGFTDVYLYLSTPVGNLYYAAAHGIAPLGYPYFTTQLLLPTIIRQKVYHAHVYPIPLRVQSFNATTFYSPFVADFGLMAAGLLVVVIQLIASYVHVKARRGDLYSQLIYAPIFAALVLSFFYNYFVTLTVLAYPVLVWIVRRAVRPHAHLPMGEPAT